MKFKRHIEQALLSWISKPDRKPLVLQGARQVGKTYLLKSLGKEVFAETAYFNFEETPDLKQLFQNTRDVQRILQNLSLVFGKEIKPETTLIIFDEIQECNEALNSLKYFYENAPKYAVTAAGSLLGVSLSKTGSFPVGKVEFLQVHPLTFTEFLQVSDPQLSQYLLSYSIIEEIPDIFFNALLENFRNYFISGGMPEAAATLLQSKSWDKTEKVLQDILRAYQLDFSKHTPSKDIPRIGYLWNSIPAQLGRENKKFIYKVASAGARAREYEDALLWLELAGLIHKVNRNTKPHIPLSTYDDVSAFKIYLMDVGLLRSLAKLNAAVLLEKHGLFTEFKGSLTENYILQSLTAQLNVPPRYWTSEGRAEVDFLIQYNNQIIPCEVKADENTRSRSLTVYTEQYHPKIRIRYSLLNLRYDDGLLNIPLFMADKTHQFLDMYNL